MQRRLYPARYFERVLRRIPAVVPLLLWWRRRQRQNSRIRRVIISTKDACRRYGGHSFGTLQHGIVTIFDTMFVQAQPVSVIGPDRTLLWAYAPQLQRSALTADIIWKYPPKAQRLTGRTLFAAVDGFSYYHWLTGTLPKILLARCLDQKFDRVIVNPKHKTKGNFGHFQAESLELLGVLPSQTIWIRRGCNFLCDHLLLPEEPCSDDQRHLAAWAKDLLRHMFLPLAMANASPGPRRIFVSRAQARRRKLINEDQVLPDLVKRGFTNVTLEGLPFLTQVRWFAEAEAVIGLHGAGLANLIFAKPETRVLEILPQGWSNPCFANLSKQLDLRYTSVPGAINPGERVSFAAHTVVDRQRLLKNLDVVLD